MKEQVENETGLSSDENSFFDKEIIFGLCLLIFLLSVAISCVVSTYFIGKRIETDYSVEPVNSVESTEPDKSDAEEVEVPKTALKTIDFQPVIEDWAKSVSGKSSVLVYDLDTEEIVGSLNPSEKFNTASLYKLFVVYEGYRRLEKEEWKPEESVKSTKHTIIECLDLAIRESNSPCAEALWRKIGYEELDWIIENEFEIADAKISELEATPEGVLEMLKIYYYHPDIKNEVFLERMKDSLLNQPATEFDWRQGLPSGFSENINVYDKVGWKYNTEEERWDLYHDAAIVEFPAENRHFIVVVMTSSVDYMRIRELGTEIEKHYYQVLKN